MNIYMCVYVHVYMHSKFVDMSIVDMSIYHIYILYLHIYVYICIYLHVYINVYVHMHKHVYIYIYICAHADIDNDRIEYLACVHICAHRGSRIIILLLPARALKYDVCSSGQHAYRFSGILAGLA